MYVGMRSVNGLLQATTRCQERAQVFMCFTASQHLGVKMMVCLISFSADSYWAEFRVSLRVMEVKVSYPYPAGCQAKFGKASHQTLASNAT